MVGCVQDSKGKNKAYCASDEERKKHFSKFQIESRVLQQVFDPEQHESGKKPINFVDTYLSRFALSPDDMSFI